MDHPPDSRLDKDWWNAEARSTPQTRCRDFKPFLIHSGCVSGCVILLRGTAAIREYRFCERVSMVATALHYTGPYSSAAPRSGCMVLKVTELMVVRGVCSHMRIHEHQMVMDYGLRCLSVRTSINFISNLCYPSLSGARLEFVA